MVLRGRYAATRRGDVGNDKLRFDFISRGDDRHHGGDRGRKKKKRNKIDHAVETIVYSIDEWNHFLSNNVTLCYFALVYNIDI